MGRKTEGKGKGKRESTHAEKKRGGEKREGETEIIDRYVDYLGKSLCGRESPGPRKVQGSRQSMPGRD